MSNFLPKSIRTLIEEFSKLPGVGPKTAQRLAMHLLYSHESKVKPLGEAILKLKENVIFCDTCWNIAEENPCKICASSERDHSAICVVEDVLDVLALEKTREYNGLYHVLHGVLSPVDGVGPEQLKIESLYKRIQKNFSQENTDGGGDGSLGKNSEPRLKEIILATNPSLEGEATALYIQRLLKDYDLKLTRIARGLPVGGDLEYADEVTLSRAMNGRGSF